MAEITKVTTPMIPRENQGSRNKPISDQAFELTDPTKIHQAKDEGKILDHQRDGQAALGSALGREMLAPALKPVGEMMHAIQRVMVLLQMGISASDAIGAPEVQQLLESLYLPPEQLAQALIEQDASSVLFKGAAFDILRDILGKFPESPRLQHLVTNLLKAFENNANAENSVKTILLTCRNLLDYMFTGDREQFGQYLQGLADILLPENIPQDPDAAAQKQLEYQDDGVDPEQKNQAPLPSLPEEEDGPNQPPQAKAAAEQPPAEKAQGREAPPPTSGLGVDHKEAAQILKGNLLPLLGEIVVKYNQNQKIRDMVMVVVHNIVRVDQGTPDHLQEAISKLVAELKQMANLPPDFEEQLSGAIFAARDQAKEAGNSTMEKLANMIAKSLSSPDTSPAALRQSENLLISLLQNQNSVMNVLHFILPMETPQGRMLAELYVDPDSEERVGRSQEKARKLFLAFDSESVGAFELSFLESAERVDFAMWCPDRLVGVMGSLKRQLADIMLLHGYTMNSYQVAELVEPHTIADVFPKLLDRRMGVDVRI